MLATVALLTALTAAQWRADLDVLAREMPARHKNLFHDMSRSRFEGAIKELYEHAGNVDDLQMVAGIQRIGSMVADAHTGIVPRTPQTRFTALPLRLYIYSDGVFVQAAPPQLRGLLGARVVRVGSTPIAVVLKRLREITDHSNQSTVNAFIVYKIVRPAILRQFRIIDDESHVSFTFDVHGREKTVTLEPMARDAEGSPIMGGISMSIRAAQGSGWIDARDSATAPAPLYLRHIGEPYWFDSIPDRRMVYIQCNLVGDAEGYETLAQFFQRAFAAVDENHADRVVLDLRFNGGGDNTLIGPIVKGIAARAAVNQDRHFFVITGRLTQSAAQNLVNKLERETHAIFVGEPTGERPNHYGDPEEFELPNSHLGVRVSTKFWQDVDGGDKRDATYPGIPAVLSSKDYLSNVDPAMDAIFKASK